MREARGDPRSQIGLKRLLGEMLRGSPPPNALQSSPVTGFPGSGSWDHLPIQSQLLFHEDNSNGLDGGSYEPIPSLHL